MGMTGRQRRRMNAGEQSEPDPCCSVWRWAICGAVSDQASTPHTRNRRHRAFSHARRNSDCDRLGSSTSNVSQADPLTVLCWRPIHVTPVGFKSDSHFRFCVRSWSLVIVRGRSWSGLVMAR